MYTAEVSAGSQGGGSAINGATNFVAGLNDMVFPSMRLGVAVGSAPGSTASTSYQPNIMMTVDQGCSWLAVTGTPAVSTAAFVAGASTGTSTITSAALTTPVRARARAASAAGVGAAADGRLPCAARRSCPCRT